jgi:hypothetical protein
MGDGKTFVGLLKMWLILLSCLRRGIPNQKLERLEERHSLCWIFVKIWVIFKGDEGSTCFNYEALTVERSWQGSRGPWSY